MLALNNFVSQARAALAERRVVPWALYPADIYESWKRCVRSGLDPLRSPLDQTASADVLKRGRDRHASARRFALAEMQTLHRSIAGTNFVIAFASPDGMILDTLGDTRFEDSSHARAIRPGSVWSESARGTNGVGTAAILGRRVIVQGGEHFFPNFAALTCIAAPIFAPDGSLAGILDASSDVNARQQHTQSLIAIAATQIENGLLREKYRDSVVIAFHTAQESLRSWSAGLLAVHRDGTILAANVQAKALLETPAIAAGETFEALFRARVEDFVSQGRKRERQVLVTNAGAQLVATIENLRDLDAARAAEAAKHRPQASFVALDACVQKIVRQVEAAAARHLPILIRGETGTGKEQMARHAHAASGRRGAFVAVNCASLPASLVEAELFGYADGAFTGARRGGSTGLAKEADGGTLFLDEIGDMPVALQAVLLRFLDDWTVRPVGGTGGKVDVLLVSATNAGLDQAIAEGRFRADLLYRLNTLEVTLPPLAVRSDFEAIARHLLASADSDCSMTEKAIAALGKQPWPGNIRQLRNVLARLSLDAEDATIDEEAIEPGVGAAAPIAALGDGSLWESQKARIVAAYEKSGRNVSETSRRLNVSRNTVYRALDQKTAR